MKALLTLLLTALPMLGMCGRTIYYCDYITVNKDGVDVASGEYPSTFIIDTDKMTIAHKTRADSSLYRITEIEYNREGDKTSYLCISPNGSYPAFIKDAKSIFFCPSIGTVMIYRIKKIRVD
jgi:predicted RNA-binding Zn-ribbon protein involved in translation (DUF1610 family)